MEKRNDFTEGPITLPLIKFAIPVLLAMLLQNLYGAVDMMVIGNFGTVADVSAINSGSWIMSTITMIFIGLSMGVTILLGQKIGQKDLNTIGRVIGTAICLFTVLAVAATVLIECFASGLASVLQCPEEAFAGTVRYLRVCGIGMVFIVAYNLIGSLFRGMGNSRVPLLAVGIATVFNIIGDLVLVGVFHMGVAGAALATIVAQALSVVLSLSVVKYRGFPYEFSMKDIHVENDILKSIFSLGMPVALMDVLVSLSFLVLTAIVNSLGVEPSAGVGVAQKLCGFIMLVPSCFNQSMSAFVAQNIGAGKWDRALKTLRTGLILSVIVGTFMAFVTFFYGDYMAYIFASDKPAVIAYAFDYLRAYAIDTFLVSFLFCFIGFFSGCGKTKFVMLQGLVGSFGVRIPLSFLFVSMQPVSLFRIGMATPASSMAQLVLCLVFFAYLVRKHRVEKTV